MQAVQQVLSKATNGAIGTKLPTRKLGKNGPPVTALGYGTMGLSAFYGTPKPDAERFAMLDKLYADGELFWDTSDIYGDSEDLLGLSSKWDVVFGDRWADSGNLRSQMVQAEPRQAGEHLPRNQVWRTDG